MKRTYITLLVLFTVLSNTVAQVSGVSLLPTDSIPFKTYNSAGATLSNVKVEHQPFQRAHRISTLQQTDNANFTLRYRIEHEVHKGDVLLLSFYTRSLQSKKETGESFLEISLDRFPNGKYEWPPLLERGMSFGNQWMLTQIPFVASRDVLKGDLALILKCGRFPQIFEVGGISLLNYKQSKKLSDLPRSIVHYDGDAPDAAWRKVAAERIEKYRKAPLTVKVVDASGKPVSGAAISVKMTKNAFAWGTATASQRILDTNDSNSKIYRDTLLRYFNKVVLENEMKAKNWSRFNETQTQNGINWLKSHDIPVRGHVMVWPSWQHSPHLEKYKSDKEALREAIFTQINEQTTQMKAQFTEWDVINEPYAHHNIIDSLGGPEVMVKWFQAARKNLPDVKLFLNDYTMFHAEKAGSDHFYNTVKFLIEKGAPIDGIGEQGHIGGTPPGIEYILSRLDRFAEFGLPIQISEFDITSDDDDFKARYLRDFMTAIFSHPATSGLVQWGFWEGQHWIPAGALWDKNWNVRPHGKVFTELVSKTWRTEVEVKTAKDGAYSLNAFLGNYDIRVTFNGKTYVQAYTLDSKGGTVQVNIKK